MSTSTLGDKLRCPHCLEEIDNLENPKQLPCNHIYCSPCLETLTETVQTGVIITCSVCSTESHQFNHSFLPHPTELVEIATPDTSEGGVTKADQTADESAAKCDKCKDIRKTAVCYCVNCERKLCALHEEKHQDYFSDNEHKLVSIQAFEKTPTLYQKAACGEHGKEYGVCCKTCYCLKCPECEVKTSCTRDSEVHHFYTLKDIASVVRKEFDILMRKCSERITEMCKLEKETWQRLDELEEECKKLREEVERKTEELITQIQTECARIVRNISRFESNQTFKVEDYLADLRQNRENYEKDNISCAKFIKDNHVVEIVKQRDERKISISLESYGQLDPVTWSVDHIRDMVNGYVQYNVYLVPQAIELISSHSTIGDCYTTCFKDDGKLIVGLSCGVAMYSDYDSVPVAQLTQSNKTVTSIRRAEDETEYYLLKHSKDVRRILVTTDFISSSEVFEYDCPGNNGQFSAVGSTYIAATCPHSLVLFNKITKEKCTKTLPYNPVHLQFLPDDSLLVTGCNAVTRYKITQGAGLELIWTCEGLEKVRGLCIMSSGMIVAISTKTEDGKLFIISNDGKLLKTLIHDELATNIYGQISIHDDVLAVPYWKENNFKLFRLL